MNGTMANGKAINFCLPWYEIKIKARSGIAFMLWVDQVNQCDGQFGVAFFQKMFVLKHFRL
jgi:hypothetical protein